MKFVWLDLPDGGRIPVNPLQVAYLRPARDPQRVRVVFAAMPGGFDELVVIGEGEAIAAQLEAASPQMNGAGLAPRPDPATLALEAEGTFEPPPKPPPTRRKAKPRRR